MPENYNNQTHISPGIVALERLTWHASVLEEVEERSEVDSSLYRMGGPQRLSRSCHASHHDVVQSLLHLAERPSCHLVEAAVVGVVDEVLVDDRVGGPAWDEEPADWPGPGG